MQRPRFRDYFLLVVLAAIWGSSFMFIKLAVVDIPPLTIAAMRIVIAAAVLIAVGRMRGLRLPRGRRVWMLFVVLAITGNAGPFFLISWGESHIDSAMAAILIAFVPLSTVILAHFMTRDERLTWPKALGVGLGLFGIVILLGGVGTDQLAGDHIAQGAILLAAVSYAFASLIARRLPPMPSLATAMAVVICAVGIAVPLSLIVDRPWELAPSALSMISVVYLGVASTAMGTLILYYLIRRTGATFVSFNNYLAPLYGAVLGVGVLGEILTWGIAVGLALILLGVSLSNLRRDSLYRLFPALRRGA